MECPFCHHKELKVIDSREAPELNAIRRRRECLKCLKRFTTFETVELSIQVKKRDGSYEDFEQPKLVKGLDAACRHTTVSHEEVVLIATQITDEIMRSQVREIPTRQLGEMAMERLEKRDPIAYIRFACVYKRFKDINELTEAIQKISPEEEKQSHKNILK